MELALQSGLGAVKALSVVSQHTALEISTTLHRNLKGQKKKGLLKTRPEIGRSQRVAGKRASAESKTGDGPRVAGTILAPQCHGASQSFSIPQNPHNG